MSGSAVTKSAPGAMTAPQSSEAEITANALQSFTRCLGARDSHEVYLSAPITTGQAFVSWRHSYGSHVGVENEQYASLHYEHVISTNLTRVAPLVKNLREKFPDRLVIDPTSLEDIPGWSQGDYLAFWCDLIEKFAAMVVFADGWHFSTGCVTEFATALRTNKRVCTQSLAPLTQDEGIQMISKAIREFDRLHVDSGSLRRGLQAVQRVQRTA